MDSENIIDGYFIYSKPFLCAKKAFILNDIQIYDVRMPIPPGYNYLTNEDDKILFFDCVEVTDYEIRKKSQVFLIYCVNYVEDEGLNICRTNNVKSTDVSCKEENEMNHEEIELKYEEKMVYTGKESVWFSNRCRSGTKLGFSFIKKSGQKMSNLFNSYISKKSSNDSEAKEEFKNLADSGINRNEGGRNISYFNTFPENLYFTLVEAKEPNGVFLVIENKKYSLYCYKQNSYYTRIYFKNKIIEYEIYNSNRKEKDIFPTFQNLNVSSSFISNVEVKINKSENKNNHDKMENSIISLDNIRIEENSNIPQQMIRFLVSFTSSREINKKCDVFCFSTACNKMCYGYAIYQYINDRKYCKILLSTLKSPQMLFYAIKFFNSYDFRFFFDVLSKIPQFNCESYNIKIFKNEICAGEFHNKRDEVDYIEKRDTGKLEALDFDGIENKNASSETSQIELGNNLNLKKYDNIHSNSTDLLVSNNIDIQDSEKFSIKYENLYTQIGINEIIQKKLNSSTFQSEKTIL
ncbi:hypothetical protein EDEG_00171 [Edhazardia aedis USNM 41457]|uniref:Uncharacterized protein n=1 Tax=Edhazardia aedis (strain USNM 41457) TaxID=1003232 RepID=J8ZVK6_EDHAE|nr:hypothetical protein EDEG_00171 [Edhazardia aedis USNM 41457]|eukprot:EJW03683.1 hypothetical protein EDEG_00171 [Edhazardia aedis USNM 41457]